MDTTALAISIGLPCLGLFFALLAVVIMVASDWSTTHVEWVLIDEAMSDRLYTAFLAKRLEQIPREIVAWNKALRVNKYLARKAGVDAREGFEVIQGLRALENMSYRKKVQDRRDAKKRAITLPYYMAVGV
jgi:hypothetical protein